MDKYKSIKIDILRMHLMISIWKLLFKDKIDLHTSWSKSDNLMFVLQLEYLKPITHQFLSRLILKINWIIYSLLLHQTMLIILETQMLENVIFYTQSLMQAFNQSLHKWLKWSTSKMDKLNSTKLSILSTHLLI